MFCPECRKPMREVYAEGHYGLRLIVDQCSVCGGLWIDDHELYHIKPGEARRLHAINTDKLREFTWLTNATPVCPRHHVALVRFRDPHLPPTLIIEKCPICHGFWFNRGEFTALQDEAVRRRGNETLHSMRTQLGSVLKQGESHHHATLNKAGRFIVSSGQGMPDFSFVRQELGHMFGRYFLAVQASVIVLRILMQLLMKK